MEFFFASDPIANTSCKDDGWVVGNFYPFFPPLSYLSLWLMTMPWLHCLWCCHHISTHWWWDSDVLSILLWAQSRQCCLSKAQYLVNTICLTVSSDVYYNSGSFYFVEVSGSWMILSLFLSRRKPSCGLWSVGRGCSIDQSGLSIHYMFCWD